MSRNSNTVKKDVSEAMQSVTIKEEQYDVKMEELSLSLSTKLETQTVDTPVKVKRTRQSFSHLPSVKQEALATFAEIRESIYQYDDLGESQQEDVMACECKPHMGTLFQTPL